MRRVSTVSERWETKQTYQFLGDLGVLDLRGLVECHAADELC
jgi:hypothetical protein